MADGTPISYEQIFNSWVASGKIVKRGLKKDAKVFDELIFDVNSAYFEENGGYEFAKKFFEEAYNLAVKEVGGEEYILSAIMHADEKNTALSEKLGYDVYHYHLHVVYIPIVQKEVKWTKRCKDPNLVGTIKEVISQISHSKKWSKFKNENGKWVNSYSLLQDRFYEHMKAAGFDGFERGERGSTSEHLSVLDYKIQQDKKRLAANSTLADKKQKEADFYVQETKVLKEMSASQKEIDGMAHLGKSGDRQIITNDDWRKVSEMAKRCVLMDVKVKDLKKEFDSLKQQVDSLKKQVQKYKTLWENLYAKTQILVKALAHAPKKLMTFVHELLSQPPENVQEKSIPVQEQNKPKFWEGIR